MDSVRQHIDDFVKIAGNPQAAIAKAMKDTGKDAFGVFPIYTPEELVYASGLLPVGCWGGNPEISKVDKYFQSYCCSIMRANMELGITGKYDFLKGVLIPTYCDTMKAVLVNWSIMAPRVKVIEFSTIQNRGSSGSFKYLTARISGVRTRLQELTGKAISDKAVEDAFELYEDYRASMRTFVEIAKNYPLTVTPTIRHAVIKSAYFTDKDAYTRKMKDFIKALSALPHERANGPKVVVTGLMCEPSAFLDLFSENGYVFVEDDLAQESRQFRTLARKEGAAIDKIAYRFLDLKGDTFFYEENKSRGRILIDTVKRNGAAGVVVSLMKFCDPDEFDFPVYKAELEAAGIPILYLEYELGMSSAEQLRTRIQSFAEMLIA
jgi:bcr-type benzoyl-CoA reductase subunit C